MIGVPTEPVILLSMRKQIIFIASKMSWIVDKEQQTYEEQLSQMVALYYCYWGWFGIKRIMAQFWT